MEGLTTHVPMTDLLRGRGVFDRHPFVLIDAGCAGGIDSAWRAFGPSLIAHGYDPDVTACEEAQARESVTGVRYHAGYVGLPESDPFVQRRKADAASWPETNIWGRITAGHLAERAQQSAPAVPPRMADPDTVVGVHEIVRAEGLSTVDFLKVDVDGPDVEVLESAREVLAESRVLGVGMEVNWFGSANPTEHTFHNTDRFLRDNGFTLFGLTFRTYSRTDLPAPFEYEIYAQTRFGQPYQGDAIYVRDLAAPHLAGLAADFPPDKLIKLACIYELIGLPDCAAEVLNRFAPSFSPFGDLEPLLDALTPPLLGEHLTYREYIARFNSEPQLFLPSAAASSPEPPAPAPPPGQRPLGIVPADRFEEMHRLVDSPAFDLPLENWQELYDLTLAFRPDLVLELGRGCGNSTCVFTEAAQSLQCRVVSIGFDAEQAWETGTAPRLARVVDADWFAPLTAIQADITTFDFRPLLEGSTRTLVYWDAHGADVAEAIFERLIPALPQANTIVVDNVWQAPEQYGQRAEYQAGPLWSLFDEILVLWDYLSERDIEFASGSRSITFTAPPAGARSVLARVKRRIGR